MNNRWTPYPGGGKPTDTSRSLWVTDCHGNVVQWLSGLWSAATSGLYLSSGVTIRAWMYGEDRPEAYAPPEPEMPETVYVTKFQGGLYSLAEASTIRDDAHHTEYICKSTYDEDMQELDEEISDVRGDRDEAERRLGAAIIAKPEGKTCLWMSSGSDWSIGCYGDSQHTLRELVKEWHCYDRWCPMCGARISREGE